VLLSASVPAIAPLPSFRMQEAATSCVYRFETAAQLEQWCTPTPAAELPLLAALNLSWASNDAVAAPYAAPHCPHLAAFPTAK